MSDKSLNEIAMNNLVLLQSLEKKDIISASQFELLKPEEGFIQVDNTYEIESAIYFSFHQLFMSKRDHSKSDEVREIFLFLNETFTHIQENDQLKTLMNQPSFRKVMDDIGDKLVIISDIHYIYSDLYPFVSYVSNMKSYFYDMMNNIVDFFKELHRINMEYHDEYVRFLSNEESEDKVVEKESSDNDSSEEEGEKEEEQEEEEGEEEEEVETTRDMLMSYLGMKTKMN